MSQTFKNSVLGAVALAVGGCATVSVYESADLAEVAQSGNQTDLALRAETFHDRAEQSGWTQKEEGLAFLSGVFGQTGADSKAYWQRIGAETNAPQSVQAKISADLAEAHLLLRDVNVVAAQMVQDPHFENSQGTKMGLTKTDVGRLESVLISARRVRVALAEALSKANERTSRKWEAVTEFNLMDNEIQTTARLTDELASIRMNAVLSNMDNKAGDKTPGA